MIRHFITALVLVPVLPAALLLGDGISDSRDKWTAVALNYCRASFHRIRRNSSPRILIEEQEKILNNLNLNSIADEEVIRLYSAVLDEIRHVQIADKDRRILKQKYKQVIRRHLGANILLFGTQMATAEFGTAVRTGVNSWWDFRDLSSHRDLDIWRIDKQRMGDVVDKSTHFLDSFWKLAQKNNIPDRWLVRADDLEKLQMTLQEQDPIVRLRVLKRMEGFMECYPPYWYYVARTQQTLGQLFAAENTYDKLADLAAGHFRKDDMLAAGLANRAAIQEFLGQPGAVETAEEALKFSTDVWEANLMCAQVLVRNRRNKKAEDAILRNLDVNLERERSLAALLSLYCYSKNEKKLIVLLSKESVLHDVPIPILFECTKKLKIKKFPSVVTESFAESLYAYPSINFGRDDFVIAADSNWKLQNARVSVQFGDRKFEHPQLEISRGNLRIRFRGVLDLGSPLKPKGSVSDATLILEYPQTPEVRLFLSQLIPTGYQSNDIDVISRPGLPAQTARIARRHGVLRIASVEMGGTRLPVFQAKNPTLIQAVDMPGSGQNTITDAPDGQQIELTELDPAPPPPPSDD